MKLLAEKVNDVLKVDLTENEIKNLSQQQCELILEKNLKEEEYKTVNKVFKEKITRLSKAIIDKKESREVECIKVYDVKNKKTFFRYRDKDYNIDDMTKSEYERCTVPSLFPDQEEKLFEIEI